MTTAAAETRTGQVRMIALADLRVAEWNARKTIDLLTLKNFTESIQQHGVQVPLIVRPLPASAWKTPADADRLEELFEIVAGHRRFKAASLLKFHELPCIVRELDDVAAREIGLVDNLQREDVPAMEEAEAYAELLEELGSIPALAARVGKEQAYIAKRLKLRSCTEHTRRALNERLITVDHALLLARLGEDEQNQALKWCLDDTAGAKTPIEAVIDACINRRKPKAEQAIQAQDDGLSDDEVEENEQSSRPRWRRTWEPESVQKLKDYIECESGTPLDRAPWPMDEDWLLPDVGSCLDCPKNTKANAPLFGDLDTGVAVCTDGGCFKAKTEGFVLYQIDQAKKKQGAKLPILQVSWKATTKEPRMELGEPCDGPASLNNNNNNNNFTRVPKLGQRFLAGQWVEATKKCEHTRAAVTLDWSDVNNRGYMGGNGELRKPGEIVQACVTPKCKAHPKAYERATSQPASESKSEAQRKEEARREAEKFDAFKAAEKPVRQVLYEAIRAGIKPETVKRNLLLNTSTWRVVSGVLAAAGFERDDYEECQRHFQQLIEKAPAVKLDGLLFDAAFGSLLVVDGNQMRAKDRGRAGLRELAKLAGVDAAAIERKFADPAKPAKKAPAKKAAKAPAKKAAAKKKAVRK